MHNDIKIILHLYHVTIWFPCCYFLQVLYCN